MRNEQTSRTGVPTNEALVGTLLTTKLLVHADEAIFCNLPTTPDNLIRPGLMQLNRDETAVEMFFRERGEADGRVRPVRLLHTEWWQSLVRRSSDRPDRGAVACARFCLRRIPRSPPRRGG